MAKIALCIIGTNEYMYFVPNLLRSAKEYFLKGHDVDFHFWHNNIFSINVCWDNCLLQNLIEHKVGHEPWPMMTLLRYKIITGVDLSGYDYVYYCDADMLFTAPVGDEILGDLVAVRHPGYYVGGGDWETNPMSAAYVHPDDRRHYIAGGFQGGSGYYYAAKTMAYRIDIDERRNIRARWNDESHWNCLYADNPKAFTILPPSYCMVEEVEKRKAWRINHFEPRIIALAKEHKKYQV